MNKRTEKLIDAGIETAGKVSKWGTVITVGSFIIGYCLCIFRDVKEARELENNK